MTRNEKEKNSIQAIILCRTEGRNLEEYVLKEKSPFAVTIRDRIIVEAARVARDALRAVALRLRRNSLWANFSISSNNCVPNLKSYHELRGLASLLQLGEADGRLNSLLLDRDKDMKINWTLCCSSMREEPTFNPNWSFSVNDSARRALFMFYLKAHDVFLTFEIDQDGIFLRSDIFTKEESADEDGSRHRQVTQLFTNYLLHYIWANL